MAYRKLPFGYRMYMGQICIYEQEADIVRQIYRTYASGASYLQIAGRLNTQTVPYNEPDKLWNKNMVARILSNPAYVGTESFPAILSEEEWREASKARPETGSTTGDGLLDKAIRQIAQCAECGSQLKLKMDEHGQKRWLCPSCGLMAGKATTPHIRTELTEILKAVCKEPELIQMPPIPSERDAVQQQEKLFEQVLYQTDFDDQTAKKAALGLATARLNSIGSQDYETMRIQYILAGTKPCEKLDVHLLRQIASAVLIHPSGTVRLALRNGQIIQRE